jgi:ribosome-binding factor A
MAQRIKVVVAEALGRKVKDPRLEGITVTDARVTNDLQHATIYYTVFGDQAVQADAAKGLEKAKGVLRQEVGRNITARLTPTLEFVADQIPVNASNLEELLRGPRGVTPRWPPWPRRPSTPARRIRTRRTSSLTWTSTKTISTKRTSSSAVRMTSTRTRASRQ